MVVVALLAAGSGSRFGSDKVHEQLGGKPVWMHAYLRFHDHPEIDSVLIVSSRDQVGSIKAILPEARVIAGGNTRQASAHFAFESAPQETQILMFHDAARPFPSNELISEVLAATRRSGAAAPALEVTDTIRQKTSEGHRLLDRRRLVAMQTPQAARLELWQQAFRQVSSDNTDDLALLEQIGVTPEIVPGDPANFKITFPLDLQRAEAMLGGMETRTGIGYDVHRFSDDPSRPLMLGGVHFPAQRALEGHSDADVLIHAAVDALLGAAGLGDIGQHFPPSDPQWRNEPSSTFLTHAASLLRDHGWKIVNVDIAAIAEEPKIMPRSAEIRATLARCLGVEAERVSVKATTNEGMGSIGRGAGIAAVATGAP